MESLHQSDEDLIRLELEIGDPHGVDGIIESVPPGVGMLEILHVYDSPELVRCAICHRERHNKGYVVLLENGSKVLVGNVCGSEAFPGTWEEHRRHHEWRVERKNYLVKVRPIKEQVDQAIGLLAPWAMAFKALRAELDKMYRSHHQLYDGLRYAAQSEGGALYVERKVRDLAAEEIRDRRHRRSGPVYVIQRQLVGQMSGVEMFNKRDSLALFGQAAKRLKEIKAELEKPALTNIAMGKVIGAKRDAVDLLEDAHILFNARHRFFTGKNLSLVAKWVNRKGWYGVNASVLENTLVLSDENGRDIFWRTPQIESLDLTGLEMLRQADPIQDAEHVNISSR